MPSVQPCEVPAHSLLSRYGGGAGFADCYVIEVAGVVTQAAFIEAFYTSALFKVERTLLQYLASKPATDGDAKQLAAGKASMFSAWSVESQSADELLLADFSGRTRSWLSVVPGAQRAPATSTLLYFGSAVLPIRRKGTTQSDMGWLFHALLGFHRLYSRLLLSAAGKRV
ncbi:MAG: hypothetical protein H7228_15860, partial [Polaromonas sp.]|nr:hypothetical protein [Polaromonas sp.]